MVLTNKNKNYNILSSTKLLPGPLTSSMIAPEIKMFMKMHINMSRSGIARSWNIRNLEEGIIKVVCADDWLSPTNINQLLECDTVKMKTFQLIFPQISAHQPHIFKILVSTITHN